ncbi:uncharacterized protein SPSC_01319 [Sporisorium scitamineum]|uniref:Uncharacterized protein n=1 Tax=Sporisorium scitamineum TaxID=49012 RepID=A0A127Z975_9BASI|nr:uncharacterized protein SPSC_01319 [Sporisorium scitamineum]
MTGFDLQEPATRALSKQSKALLEQAQRGGTSTSSAIMQDSIIRYKQTEDDFFQGTAASEVARHKLQDDFHNYFCYEYVPTFAATEKERREKNSDWDPLGDIKADKDSVNHLYQRCKAFLLWRLHGRAGRNAFGNFVTAQRFRTWARKLSWVIGQFQAQNSDSGPVLLGWNSQQTEELRSMLDKFVAMVIVDEKLPQTVDYTHILQQTLALQFCLNFGRCAQPDGTHGPPLTTLDAFLEEEQKKEVMYTGIGNHYLFAPGFTGDQAKPLNFAAATNPGNVLRIGDDPEVAREPLHHDDNVGKDPIEQAQNAEVVENTEGLDRIGDDENEEGDEQYAQTSGPSPSVTVSRIATMQKHDRRFVAADMTRNVAVHCVKTGKCIFCPIGKVGMYDFSPNSAIVGDHSSLDSFVTHLRNAHSAEAATLAQGVMPKRASTITDQEFGELLEWAATVEDVPDLNDWTDADFDEAVQAIDESFADFDALVYASNCI